MHHMVALLPSSIQTDEDSTTVKCPTIVNSQSMQFKVLRGKLLRDVIRTTKGISGTLRTRAHQNERLKEERITPIDARSLGKIFERY